MKKVSTIKKKAWDYCSKYIRLHYADKRGFVKCYTCGVIMFWKKIQAGHGFSGRGNSILFEEKIIRPQCMSCNYFKGGNYDVFKIKLEKEYGFEFMKDMLKQKRKLHQFTLEEITKLHDKYKGLYEKELSKKDIYE